MNKDIEPLIVRPILDKQKKYPLQKSNKNTRLKMYIKNISCIFYDKINIWLILRPLGYLFVIFSYFILLSFIINCYNIVYAESIISLIDDSNCIITKRNNETEITMETGTTFVITKKTAFDNVFNEINAPGYYKENEMVTDKVIVTMIKYVPAYAPEIVVDGNSSAEDAHYSIRSEAALLHDLKRQFHNLSYNSLNGLSENAPLDYINHLNKLSPQEQAYEIINTFMADIYNKIDNLQETGKPPILENIVKNVLQESVTKSIWLQKNTLDLDNPKGIFNCLIIEINNVLKEDGDITNNAILNSIKDELYLQCNDVLTNWPSLLLHDKSLSMSGYMFDKINSLRNNAELPLKDLTISIMKNDVTKPYWNDELIRHMMALNKTAIIKGEIIPQNCEILAHMNTYWFLIDYGRTHNKSVAELLAKEGLYDAIYMKQFDTIKK